MPDSKKTMGQRIAQAATSFQEQVTGRTPKSVNVVLNGDTLVITLHGALSLAEQLLAKNPEGAAKVQEFHRQLFLDASHTLAEEIRRITNVEVCQASAEVTPADGAVLQTFTTGTVVQVFLLKQPLPPEIWNAAIAPPPGI